MEQWLASIFAALGLIPIIPEKFSEEKVIDVNKVNQQRCIDESGQWLESVD